MNLNYLKETYQNIKDRNNLIDCLNEIKDLQAKLKIKLSDHKVNFFLLFLLYLQ